MLLLPLLLLLLWQCFWVENTRPKLLLLHCKPTGTTRFARALSTFYAEACCARTDAPPPRLLKCSCSPHPTS